MAQILHVLNLDTVGGVEQLFHHFVATAGPEGQTDHLLVTGGPIHPYLKTGIPDRVASIAYAKSWAGIKIPRWPRGLRRAHQHRLIKRINPDLGVLWNRFGDVTSLAGLQRMKARILYYENGAAWLAADTPCHREFVSGIEFAVCGSHAARRVLQLRWGYSGPFRVLLNTIRPDLAGTPPQSRLLPTDRPLRLGIAARLIPLKGIGVAINATKILQSRGQFAELHIAGSGPLKSFLEEESRRLSLNPNPIFHECVRDMGTFYDMIDILLVPSLREPFGMVIVEAASRGCPAICNKVDGTPEACLDGKTGICIAPSLPLSASLKYGGQESDFPECVYAPDGDKLIEPLCLDPENLANVISELSINPDQYERMSAAAIDHARENYTIESYRRTLRESFTEVLTGGHAQ